VRLFLINIIKFGLIVFLLAQLFGFGSLYLLRKSAFYKPSFLANQVIDKEFDYIILGSSTGLTTLNSLQIDSITGLSGINLSMDDTSMGSHYLMLEHFFGLQKKTRYCVLTISDFNMDKENSEMSGNDYRFLPFISESYVYDYYKTYEKGFIKPLVHSKYFPLLGVGYYNAEIFYPSIMSLFQREKRNRFDNKGNYKFPNTNLNIDREFKDVSFDVKNPFFEKIKSLCEQNNVELIVYQPPIFKRRSYTLDSIKNFINHSNILKGKQYFVDFLHVNEEGREKATEALANVLKSI